MSITSETKYTDPKDMRTHQSYVVHYTHKHNNTAHVSPLSPSLSVSVSDVPVTECAGVIRLECDSKWHFTHARPCRPTTQPQECASLVFVTLLPRTLSRTHISSTITHRNTQTYVTNLKSLMLTRRPLSLLPL